MGGEAFSDIAEARLRKVEGIIETPFQPGIALQVSRIRTGDQLQFPGVITKEAGPAITRKRTGCPRVDLPQKRGIRRIFSLRIKERETRSSLVLKIVDIPIALAYHQVGEAVTIQVSQFRSTALPDINPRIRVLPWAKTR